MFFLLLGRQAIKWAGNVFLAVQIGLDIWMSVLKVRQCLDTRNKVRAAYYQIAPQVQNMNNLLVEVNGHYNNLARVCFFIICKKMLT